MRLLSWNIQSGGARRAESITEFVKEIAPDVAVLTEVRETSGPLLKRLEEAGWCHQLVGAGASGCGGVAIVSRLPIQPLATPPQIASAFPGRWVEARVKEVDCTVVGLYGPLQNEDFDAFWKSAVQALEQRLAQPVVVAGDMNTGESGADAPKSDFFCSKHFLAAKSLGFVDAWRSVRGDAREYSWYSRRRGGLTGNGFRLDHALVSPALASRVRSAEYRHDVREHRVSDHAPLIVDIGSSLTERRSMRVPQRADGKGSLRWIQHLVAHPSLVDGGVRRTVGLAPDVAIEWLSPRRDDDHAEYRDGAFLDRVGLGRLADQLADFWPRGGPQWDALARTSDGKILLFEVKAHAKELASSCTAASPKSREQIERALSAAKTGLGADPTADWLNGYYQYANRLAHLHFLRERGVDAHLVFLYLVNDKDMRGPKSRQEWEAAIRSAHEALGLPSDRSIEGVHDMFVDVTTLERSVGK